jgi:hypothetical protein
MQGLQYLIVAVIIFAVPEGHVFKHDPLTKYKLEEQVEH